MNVDERSTAAEPYPILVHQRAGCGSADDARSVERVVERAMSALGLPRSREIAIVLSDDAELAELNERFRGKAGPTDVLSFPVDPEGLPDGAEAPLGDVIISVAYAGRSAEKAGHSAREELGLLAVHGLLHLIGHEDETEAGAEAMRALEVVLGVRSEA